MMVKYSATDYVAIQDECHEIKTFFFIEDPVIAIDLAF